MRVPFGMNFFVNNPFPAPGSVDRFTTNCFSNNAIQNQLLIQISPSSIPDGTAGDEYIAALSVSGGQAPYAWTLGPGSSPLPPGLTLTQNPADSSQATISGTPAIRGNYQFWIRVTDAGSRFIDQVYVLSIN